MKTRTLYLLILFFFNTIVSISAQRLTPQASEDTTDYDYRTNWRTIFPLEQEAPPRLILEKVEEIYKQARKDGKTSHEILALMTGMKWREQLSSDSLFTDIKRLEERLNEKGTTPADAAVLHSILGEVYSLNAIHGKWQTTEVQERPLDLREWNRKDYYERAFEHFTASVRLAKGKERVKSFTYYPIILRGHWSDFFAHSLTHFICKRAIDELLKIQNHLSDHKQSEWKDFPIRWEAFKVMQITPQSDFDVPATIMKIYQSLLTYYAKKGTVNDAWMLLELNRLNDIPYNSQANIDERITYLEELKQAHSKSVNCAEIYWAQANIYRYKNDKVSQLKTLEDAINRYPDYPIRNTLLNMCEQIKLPKLRFSCNESIYYPSQSVRFDIEHRNLEEATLRIYKINLPTDSISTHRFDKSYLKRHASIYDEQKVQLTPNKDYISHNETHIFTAPSVGNYLVEIIANGITSDDPQLFCVNSLTLIGQQLPDSTLRVTVLNSRTGHPVEGAYVEEAEREGKNKYINIHRYHTDKQGQVIIPTKRSQRFLRAETTVDKTMLFQQKYFSRFDNNFEEGNNENIILLMSDRTLFRPGQEVHVKGISYSVREGNRHTQKSGTPFVVRLYDGSKILSEKRVKSNEFGSFSTTFTLPENISGNPYYIQAFREGDEKNKKSLFISIEEYKLPNFEVILDSISQTYETGDTITISGTVRSFMSVPIAYATVKHSATLTRHMIHRYNIRSQYKSDEQHGETVTDENGRFQFRVVLPLLDEDEEMYRYWNDNMLISVDVLSQTGEQQSAVTRLRNSNIPYKINIKCDKWLLKASSSCGITIGITNLSGVPVDAEATYEIYRKEYVPTDDQSPTAHTINEHLIYKGKAIANREYSNLLPDTLSPGSYRIRAFLIHKGDTISDATNLRIYSLSATRPGGTRSTNELLTIKQFFSPDDPACIQWGTHERDVYVHYHIYSKEGITESQNFIASDTAITFSIDYLPKYGKGIVVQICYLKNGKFHSNSTILHYKEEEKELKLKWHTFRDHLHPGTAEKWILNISNPNGTPARAELLAGMYDDALNHFYYKMRNWHIPYSTYTTFFHNYWISKIGENDYFSQTVPFEYIKNKDVPKYWRYDMFLSRMFPWRNKNTRLGSKMNATLAENSIKSTTITGAIKDESVFMNKGTDEQKDLHTPRYVKGNGQYDQTKKSIRTNFNETAFFLPHLRTDKKGNVSINFTLPESLTRWQFRAFAHTKDMTYGTLNDMVTAEKAFTVQGYLPRFIRTNDNTTVKAQITNLTNTAINGTARLELFDPKTERIICKRKASFNIDGRKSGIVNFEFYIEESESCPLPACRIVAEADGFSDGEQHYLPVLDNRTEITESIPLFIKDEGILTQSLQTLFNKLSSSSRNRRLIIEATGSPAWLAIQALPTIATPEKGSAIDYALAYYAQTLGAYLIAKHPDITTQLERWTQTDDSSLWSELQKDSELKSILSDETPWLVDAKEEADQRKRILTFFNTNVISLQRSKCLRHLKECMNGDGWSWYNGMNYNRFVTITVLQLINRAQALTGYQIEEFDTEFAKSIKRIEAVIDKEIEKELKHTKEEKLFYIPTETTIDYLYSRSLTNRPINNDQLTTSLINLLPQSNLYERARIACILYHEREKETAQKCVQSLIEYSVCTPHLGRYYDSNQAAPTWRNHRIATHTAAMEAIRLISPEQTEILDEMRQWLIAQKQAQAWNSSVNTADAVFALLCDNQSILNKQQPLEIFLDGEAVQDTTHSPLNYLKRCYNENELKNLPKEIRLVKKDKGFAYGAIYAQYTDKLTNITSSTKESNSETGIISPLLIERQLLVKRIVDGKEKWERVADDTPLKIGDQLTVRLVITTDREMTFVQIKDGRPACCEPTKEAQYIYFTDGFCYQQVTKDASTLFFIDRLPKGTHIIEHRMHIDRSGTYQAGLATIQSAYAPEFTAHSKGLTMQVADK